MKPELKQLDLFFQDLPQGLPEVSMPREEEQPLPKRKETVLVKTELQAIQCKRCGEWLCDALAGASAYCPSCRIWSGPS